MSVDEQLVQDRRHTWHVVSQLLFWGAIHAAVVLVVVVIFALNGPVLTSWFAGVILIGASLAATAAFFRRD